MEKITIEHLNALAADIAAEISKKRGAPTEVHIHKQISHRSICLGKFGAHPLVVGKTPSELHARGSAYLDGLRFQ
ncbi:hypothetical protein [Pseudoxanthomonas sp. UC19_8]|uniref:hypothetical protein n=1 Tax=Pseudoxanthomonas sp. UC19_8 TaxID=3350175 RepID=UPI0036D2C2BB